MSSKTIFTAVTATGFTALLAFTGLGVAIAGVESSVADNTAVLILLMIAVQRGRRSLKRARRSINKVLTSYILTFTLHKAI